MTLQEMRIPFTVDASGDAVVYGERPVFARLIAVFYDRGDMDTDTDFVLTTDRYDVVEDILTITNAGTSDVIWYPRRLVQGGADGANLTGTSGGDREPYLIIGRPKLTVDEGGSETSGAFILIYEE
jgi:hypothetical protein